MAGPPFIWLFICRWACGCFPPFGYCEYCCSEHGCMDTGLYSSFLTDFWIFPPLPLLFKPSSLLFFPVTCHGALFFSSPSDSASIASFLILCLSIAAFIFCQTLVRVIYSYCSFSLPSHSWIIWYLLHEIWFLFLPLD